MCGIAGVVPLNRALPAPSLEQLQRMAGALRHRGPDEFGIYRDRFAGLAHARLSIIDIASGQQPLPNQDGSMWIVFNGEIFNYLELRAELQAQGQHFKTRSDTEVIVQAYQKWGDGAFERFNGQFAVALWDAKRRSLVLARDRLGVRPLYFCEHQGCLFFASEVKAIFASEPSIPRAFDPVGLDQTFTLWSTVPPQTVFAGVRQIEPGHIRTYRDGEVTDRCFWRPKFPIGGEPGFKGSMSDAVVAVRQALEKATSLRMLRADVPVGSYLSGGLDSSLVAALGLRAKGEKFRTFSLRFHDAEYDETHFQQLMVEAIGSDHTEVTVSRADIARIFPAVIRQTEAPILRTAPAPLFLLSQLVRDNGIKVVLTGEGADEMFAGYDLFREAKVRRFWARNPKSTVRPRLLERLYPYLHRSPVSQQAMAREFFGRNLERSSKPGFSHDMRWETTRSLRRLFAQPVREAMEKRDAVTELVSSLPQEFGRWTSLAQDQYLEIRTLLTGYLLSSQGDRMLMANSVEGRFPFLDVEVVELANSLPPEFKLRGLNEKHVLKRVAADLIPAEIIARKKQPYRAPDALSFVGEHAPEWIGEVLTHQAVAKAGVFHPDAVAQLWKKCQARADKGQFSNTDNMALVGVLSTQLLDAEFISRSPGQTAPVTFNTLIDRCREEAA